eukprot:12406954-Karenia_brevis.AAC.1
MHQDLNKVVENATQIQFLEQNPHRADTQIHELYERVKAADSVAEAKEYGASQWQLKEWLKKGYLTIERQVISDSQISPDVRSSRVSATRARFEGESRLPDRKSQYKATTAASTQAESAEIHRRAQREQFIAASRRAAEIQQRLSPQRSSASDSAMTPIRERKEQAESPALTGAHASVKIEGE